MKYLLNLLLCCGQCRESVSSITGVDIGYAPVVPDAAAVGTVIGVGVEEEEEHADVNMEFPVPVPVPVPISVPISASTVIGELHPLPREPLPKLAVVLVLKLGLALGFHSFEGKEPNGGGGGTPISDLVPPLLSILLLLLKERKPMDGIWFGIE